MNLQHYFSQMLLIRRFEERSGQLYTMGQIGGFCHLCIGQEAIYVGIADAMQEGDTTITSYRDHGMILALGGDPFATMAELTGRETGLSKGKGGSMHMYDIKRKFYGGNGIVGAQVPLGTGLALAMKYRGENNVSITLMGDGAVNQGQVYESFNMAKLWKLPVLYVVENNEYGMGTSVERACATTDLYRRGDSFDIEGRQINGMDVIAVRDAFLNALEQIRRTSEPLLLELKTYRYRGHSMSDPANYRGKDELCRYKTLDPIELIKERIIKDKVLTEDEIEKIECDTIELIKKVVDFALESKEPDADQLMTDIYKQ